MSGFTQRRAYAAAFVIGLFILSFPVSAILTLCEEGSRPPRGTCEPPTGDAAKWFALLNVTQVPTYVNDMIFPGEDDGDFAVLVNELPDAVPIGWYLLLVVGPATALWWRYRRLEQ